MKEPPRPDDQFDQQLRARAQELRSARDPCPDGHTLLRFASGELSGGDALVIESHLGKCGLCDAAVFRVQNAKRLTLWHPLPGYLAAAGFAVALILVLRWEPKSQAKLSQEEGLKFESVQVVSLDSTRKAESTPRLNSARDKFVALAFFVPTESETTWTASVRDRADTTVISQSNLKSYDRNGNFLLILPRQSVKSGEYRLTVEDSGGKRYHFEFTL